MGPIIATRPPESLTCQQEDGDEDADSDSDGDGDSTGSSSSESESEDETNGKVELNTENTQESKS